MGDRNIYDIFAAKFNMVDQYHVEHVHSVIRRQTKVILMSRCGKQFLEFLHLVRHRPTGRVQELCT